MTFRRNLPLLLLRVRELVRAQFQPVFREHGITEQQWRILRSLYEKPGQSVVEIADACCIMRPSIVGIIARMIEMGLLEREKSHTDKRRSHVHLTVAGRDMVQQILPKFERIYLHIEDEVGKKRLDGLYRTLDDFSKHMGEARLVEELRRQGDSD